MPGHGSPPAEDTTQNAQKMANRSVTRPKTIDPKDYYPPSPLGSKHGTPYGGVPGMPSGAGKT